MRTGNISGALANVFTFFTKANISEYIGGAGVNASLLKVGNISNILKDTWTLANNDTSATLDQISTNKSRSDIIGLEQLNNDTINRSVDLSPYNFSIELNPYAVGGHFILNYTVDNGSNYSVSDTDILGIFGGVGKLSIVLIGIIVFAIISVIGFLIFLVLNIGKGSKKMLQKTINVKKE